LLLEFPLQRRDVWLFFSITTLLVCLVLHLLKKRKDYAPEFLLSFMLFVAGASRAFDIQWLKWSYFPFLLIAAALYDQKFIFFLLLAVPFLELKSLLNGGEKIVEEIAFILSLFASAGVFLLFKRRIMKTHLPYTNAAASDNDSLSSTLSFREQDDIREDLKILPQESPEKSQDRNKSFSEDEIISHYLESMFRPEDELKELLMLAKNTVFADSVHLFVSSEGILRLRCSTDEEERIILSVSGILQQSFRERKAFIESDITEKKIEIGYLKKDKISSAVIVPVLDGNFALGVISADSARFHAFSSADRDILEMFSHQVTGISRRERVYPQIYRSYAHLKILHEESSRLLSSLDKDVVIRNLINGAKRIGFSEMHFLMTKGAEFEIFHETADSQLDTRVLSLKGSLLDMAVKNRRPVYISDVKDYRSPVMPFKTDNVKSAFILPLFYERDLLGILILLSDRTRAFSTHQRNLLEVLVNQASTSMANAKFHAEIERLAVTDGLTGLFNHRHFQEKLTGELQRRERFPESLSLLIIDIDYFKKINDTYGHPMGDAVLKTVAGIIGKTVRNIDISARYGGEEFAVILLGTEAKGAQNMAERLRKVIMNETFTADGDTFNITVSIGISTYADGVKRKEELVERADKALYHAKQTGRNRCVLWSEKIGQP